MKIVEKKQVHDNIIDNILHNSHVDIDYHLNPTKEGFDSSVKKCTFYPGIMMLNEHIYEHNTIGIIADDDVDGYTSSALLYRFLVDDLGVDESLIKVLHHNSKAHGITQHIQEQMYKKAIDILLVPDAGSNDREAHFTLNEKGVDILILDHHQYDFLLEPHERTIIINNQNPDTKLNKNLTGVGVVYKFIEAYKEELNIDVDITKYLDLVMLGQTADVSDISDRELRYYIAQGVDNPLNKLLLTTLKDKDLESGFATRDMSFSLISMINSVSRVGTLEEKQLLFKALVSDDNTLGYEISKRSKNKSTGKMETRNLPASLHDITYNTLKKVKGRQDRLVKKAMQEIEYINQEKILIGTIPKEYPTSVNGLVAMKIMSKTGLPVMIGEYKNGTYAGSARANFNLNQFLNETNLFKYVQGHLQAFGWGISESNLNKFIELLHEKDLETDLTHYVDRVYNSINHKPYLDVMDIEDNKNVFGGKLQFPLLAFKDVSFHKSCINARGSVLNLFDNELSFVMFNSKPELYNELMDNIKGDRVHVNIVGEPGLDWNNKPQIVIKDIEVIEQHEELVNDWGIDF